MAQKHVPIAIIVAVLLVGIIAYVSFFSGDTAVAGEAVKLGIKKETALTQKKTSGLHCGSIITEAGTN